MRRFLQLSILGAAALCLTLTNDADAGGRGRGGVIRGGDGAGLRPAGPPPSQAQRDQRHAELVEALDLTQDQQTQWEQLREEGRAAMENLRTGGEASREEMAALRASHREAFEALLTPEQRTVLQQLHAERGRPERGRRQGAHRGEGVGAGPAAAAERRSERRAAFAQALGLSEQQQTQLDEIRQAHHEAIQALRAQGDVDREAIKALRDQQRADLATVLTTEQLATLEQLHQQRGPRPGRRQGPGPEGDAPEQIGDAAGKAAVDDTGWADIKTQSR